MDGQNSQGSQFSRTNVPDYQKMLQTSATQDSRTPQQPDWHDEVVTVTPSPVIQHPHSQPATVSPPMARRRFHHNFTRESWDGGGGGGGGGGGVGSGGGGQAYQPSKYGLVVEEMFRGGSGHGYGQRAGYDVDHDYRYATSGGGGGGPPPQPQQQSPVHSPSVMRRVVQRGPAENRRSFPDNSSRTQHLLEEYYDGYGSSSTAGGSTSGYGSGGGVYEQPGNIRATPLHKSSEFPEGTGLAKPRSILRNSHSQGQLAGGGRERTRTASPSGGPPSSSYPGGPSPSYPGAHQEALQSQGNMKSKSVGGDLRQWQQQHQEELLHQHIETQALYEKPMAPMEPLVRQCGMGEEEPARWEPVRRAADNIIREKNMIIEKLRQRSLELEEDLKMADNKLRHAVMATDDKTDIVTQKIKELQYKNATLKSEVSEMRVKKNGEINSLEEQLGAVEHELQQVKTQGKMKEADFSTLEMRLVEKDREVEEWGRRFQEMKTNHQQLRHKLDSVERYLSDLPTAEETISNTQEHILRLKEEHAQNKFRADDLEQKLSAARKQLVSREQRLQEAEGREETLGERLGELERELGRVRQEDTAAHNLFRAQHDLDLTRKDKDRLAVDLEKAKKLLETTHRRLRQTETKLQAEVLEVRERLGREEEAVEALRQEVLDKERQVEKTKRLVKELGSQNQDLMEQNLTAREQLSQVEQQSGAEGAGLQRRFMSELGLCVSELQALVHVCLQRARGEDPNMSVLLGVRDVVAESSEQEQGASGGSGLEKGQTIRQWLSKLEELRAEVDGLRASLCNQYAEDMGQSIQCATQ